MERFGLFLQDRRSDLRKIAHRTQGEMTPEDLSSEAWLVALEMEEKMGRPFDFASLVDQDRLLAWLHNRFVKFADKSVRHAVRLDTGWDDEGEEGAGSRMAALLTGPDNADPHRQRLAQDESEELLQAVRRSYSQAAAFVILLVRTDWDVRALAAELWLGVATLRRRMGKSADVATRQATLFDGVEEIPLDFAPSRKRPGIKCLFGAALQKQSEWWSYLRELLSPMT